MLSLLMVSPAALVFVVGAIVVGLLALLIALGRYLPRWFSWLRFSLRTLLLATFALGASGVAYLHWNPFVPTGQSSAVKDVTVLHATIEFSPDSQQLLYTKDNKIFLWDLAATHRQLETKPALSYVQGARFSDDGASIIAFSHDKVVRFALAGEVQNEIADVAVKAPQNATRFQSACVLTVANNGRYALIEEATHIRTANGGEGRLSDTPQFLQLLDCSTGKILVSFPSDHLNANTTGISEDGQRICWESMQSGRVKLTVFDLGASQPREMHTDSQHTFQGKLVPTRDRRTVAYACNNHGVEILDLENMQVVERIGMPEVQAAFLSPDGSRLATVSNRDQIMIWKPRRTPGAFGPFDFPELWLASVLVLLFVLSLIADLINLRRAHQQPTASGKNTTSSESKPALS